MNANTILIATIIGGLIFLMVEFFIIAAAVMVGNIWARQSYQVYGG